MREVRGTLEESFMGYVWRNAKANVFLDENFPNYNHRRAALYLF